MRILVTETLSQGGMEILSRHGEVDVRKGLTPEELRSVIGDYEALVVRSRTQVTTDILEAGKRLKVVGRAGTGVDNIDVDAATRCGVLVVNAPTGNSNAVAEHTIALMLALARRLYEAVSSLKNGRWEKSKLEGQEVKGKTLGLLGLGRIGALVASRARALEMRVVAFDPYTSAERAVTAGVELVSLDELLSEADFISVHTPLTPQTQGMLDAEQLAKCKPGAYIINCARGGIVDEVALKEALQQGRLGGAALDVFEVEPVTDHQLVALPNVIATPHVGASTVEAQENVALDVAQAIADVLQGRVPASPVNVPYLPPKDAEYLRPYIDMAQRLGSFFIQWRGALPDNIELEYEGEVGNHDTRVLTSAFLAGLLAPVVAEPVNIVNAQHVARRRGLAVSETRRDRREHYDSLINACFADRSAHNISGTVIQGEPHLVRLDDQWLDCVMQGRMLVDLHHDRPGIVGGIGQLLGEACINISFVQMSRVHPGGPSIMILGLDEEVPAPMLPRFLEVPNVQRVRMVSLPLLSEHLFA